MSTINLNKLRKQLLFLPLGGSGEIGMNLNLYHYMGKWLIIDMGAGFADDYLPGVDMIVPDISFLKTIKNDILGLILTHAHEDHLGAVQYLWNEINCPIYTTAFTANFLKMKLVETYFAKKITIHTVPVNSRIELDPFVIDLVSLTHSAPEMQALMIRTELGNILHTGDWKFDHDPLIGLANDEDLLEKYGQEGVLALIGDSTNVFNQGSSGSEGDLRKSMEEIIGKCQNMVAVTTFASNVARIETIIKTAEKCKRKVVLAGKSLWRVVSAAKESGYLKDIPAFIDEKNIDKYPRNQILILCTGCQGETLAATTKIASGSHPYIKLKSEDTIIFSSKIIPGNEKKIYRLFNIFVNNDIEILTEKDHFVHVSGHPAREELKKMYSLVKPKIAVPVHGELVHINEHAKLARDVGVPETIRIQNGDILRIAPGKAEIIEHVQSGYLAIDGNCLLDIDSKVMKARRRIQNDGAIIVTLIFNKRQNNFYNPVINAPGILDIVEDEDIIKDISKEIMRNMDLILRDKNTKEKNRAENLINITKSSVRRIIKPQLGKNPLIEVNIENI